MSEDINDVVRAKRFELVDDAGQVRSVLSSGPEGRVVLTFMGAENPAIRAALGIGSDGGAFLNLFDDQERVRVNLSVNARGCR